MSSQEFKKLEEMFTSLKTSHDELAAKFSTQPTEKPAGNNAPTAEQFSALQQENADLKTKVEQQDKDIAEYKSKTETLTTQVTEFGNKLAEAMKEKSGTPSGGEGFGAGGGGADNAADKVVFA